MTVSVTVTVHSCASERKLDGVRDLLIQNVNRVEVAASFGYHTHGIAIATFAEYVPGHVNRNL